MVRLDLPCSPFRDFLDLIITMFSWYNIINFTQGREKLEADRQTQAGPGCHEKDTILPGNKMRLLQKLTGIDFLKSSFDV